jgi:hypothetical protein
MPLASVALLVITLRAPHWRLPPLAVRTQIARNVIAGVLVVGVLPLGVAWFFERSSIGEAKLIVTNGTGKQLYVFYRPGYDPGTHVEPGDTVVLHPLFKRFDNPDLVTFTSGGRYWECEWDSAKEHEPLLIDDANVAECHEFDVPTTP